MMEAWPASQASMPKAGISSIWHLPYQKGKLELWYPLAIERETLESPEDYSEVLGVNVLPVRD